MSRLRCKFLPPHLEVLRDYSVEYLTFDVVAALSLPWTIQELSLHISATPGDEIQTTLNWFRNMKRLTIIGTATAFKKSEGWVLPRTLHSLTLNISPVISDVADLSTIFAGMTWPDEIRFLTINGKSGSARLGKLWYLPSSLEWLHVIDVRVRGLPVRWPHGLQLLEIIDRDPHLDDTILRCNKWPDIRRMMYYLPDPRVCRITASSMMSTYENGSACFAVDNTGRPTVVNLS